MRPTPMTPTRMNRRLRPVTNSCDSDVESLVNNPKIRRQLDKIPAEKIRAELKEYGAWDETELADHEENKRRVVWLAAGNITEESAR